MSERNLIMPGNPRYQSKELREIFGYDNLYGQVIRVELAGLITLADIGIISKEEIELLTPDVEDKLFAITTTNVDKIEREITKHDIRALVREMQGILDPRLGRWLHIPFTSYDPLDTGRSLQFLSAYKEALRPAISEVIMSLADLTEQYAGELQIGRTHGQHALPITVGFWLATILSRMVYNFQKMNQASKALVGKISGAVGAYNAQIGLGIREKCGNKSFEERVLGYLGLEPAKISTQILSPEPLAELLFSCCLMSATLAQFGRDCRHLMRSEIGEVAESFDQGQVGSSTMAHKRNPINFENLEGMWLRTKNEFGKVLDTLISEHQRDLVGSCVVRDFPIIMINLQQQLDTLLRKNKQGVPFLKRLTINPEACRKNFEQTANLILAEPIYIALQMAGYQGDAHKLVNEKLVPKAGANHLLLVYVLEEASFDEPELRQAVEKIPVEVRQLLQQPEKYTGLAEEKARQIAGYAKTVVSSMK